MVAQERDDAGPSGGFDPRYDPAFQRGYQPGPGERTRTRVRADAPEAAFRRPSSLLRGPEDRSAGEPAGRTWAVPLPEELPADTGTAAPVRAEQGAEPSPSPAPEASAGAATAGLARIEVDPRRNPLVLALWIVGPGLVVLGIVLYCISVTSSYNGPTPTNDVGSLVFAQLGWMLAGPLITVGLLTVVGLLFLTALAGRRPRDTAAPPDEL
jgi:hypothetical protein